MTLPIRQVDEVVGLAPAVAEDAGEPEQTLYPPMKGLGEEPGNCGTVTLSSVAAGDTAPAGIVRIPGEELLEAIESEEDIVRANRELTEGTPQTTAQTEQWRRLYGEIMNEANKRLRGRQVMLLVAVPEPNGLGCVFTGVDLPRFEAAKTSGVFLPGGEDYEVILTLPARERVDLRRAGREEFVRKFINVICDAVLEQKAGYERRAAMH